MLTPGSCVSLELGSGPLAEFFSRTAGQSAEERAVSLEQFQQLEAAHEAAGHEGQTDTPSRDDKLDKHFIAFVQKDGHLYELGELPRGHGYWALLKSMLVQFFHNDFILHQKIYAKKRA